MIYALMRSMDFNEEKTASVKLAEKERPLEFTISL